MENLTLNFVGKAEFRSDNGTEYLVAPLTLIVPGVLNGSAGPLYYPADEIAKSRESWNGVPLVVNHPTVNGESVSVKTDGVLDEFGIGHIRNASIDGRGHLKAEGWFAVDQTSKVDKRILTSLQDRRPIELSTGLMTENEHAPGATPTGDVYTYIARNYEPDHLAILPDQVGACSIKDGCGVLMNEQAEDGSGASAGPTKTTVGNELSIDTIKDVLRQQLRDRFSTGAGLDTVYLEDLFQNRVVFLRKERYFSLPYTRTREKVVLSGDLPTEVIKVVRWKPVNGKMLNSEGDTMSLSDEKRLEMVDSLIENSCCYDETNRSDLMDLNDAMLTNAVKAVEKVAEESLVANAAKEGFEDADGNRHTYDADKKTWATVPKEPVENATNTEEEMDEKKASKPMTENEWLESAPESVQNTFRHAQVLEQREKDAIVEKLIGNVGDDKKESVAKVLNSKSLDELTVLASLAPKEEPPQQHFIGASAVDNMGRPGMDQASEDHLLLPGEAGE